MLSLHQPGSCLTLRAPSQHWSPAIAIPFTSSTSSTSFRVASSMGEDRTDPDAMIEAARLRAQAHAAFEAEVAQALEIARDSADGAKDPSVRQILETAIDGIWKRIQEQPDSYLMTRNEFAVFNYFQERFAGNSTAVAARRRYWDYTRA